MNVLILFTLVVVLVLATGTAVISDTEQPITFGGDLAFLGQHTDVVVLSESAGGARVVVSPALQGRVLTSTAGGSSDISFGWINRELIASGKTVEHTNAYGGEDRFWIGPEGGQFSVFFKRMRRLISRTGLRRRQSILSRLNWCLVAPTGWYCKSKCHWKIIPVRCSI